MEIKKNQTFLGCTVNLRYFLLKCMIIITRLNNNDIELQIINGNACTYTDILKDTKSF